VQRVPALAPSAVVRSVEDLRFVEDPAESADVADEVDRTIGSNGH
jgi:hypothetical protein